MDDLPIPTREELEDPEVQARFMAEIEARRRARIAELEQQRTQPPAEGLRFTKRRRVRAG